MAVDKTNFRYIMTTESLVIVDADPNVLVSLDLLKELEIKNAQKYMNGSWMILYENEHDASVIAQKYFSAGSLGLNILSSIIDHAGKVMPSLGYLAKEYSAVSSIPFILSLLLIKDYLALGSGRFAYYNRHQSSVGSIMITTLSFYEPPKLPLKPRITSLKKNINYIRAFLMANCSVYHAADILGVTPPTIRKHLTECGFINSDGVMFHSLADWYLYNKTSSVSYSKSKIHKDSNHTVPQCSVTKPDISPGSINKACIRIIQLGAEFFRCNHNVAVAAKNVNMKPAVYERDYVKKLFNTRGDLSLLGILAFFEAFNKDSSFCASKLGLTKVWFRRRLLQASRTYYYDLDVNEINIHNK